MQEGANEIFISLFKETFVKCFGAALQSPLTETECKHFSNAIFEVTGLVIGAKSLKNYSFYVLNAATAKQEKPSVATLDTLARYVLNAPYTDELKRKEKEAHFPYWFQYRNNYAAKKKAPEEKENVVATNISTKNKRIKIVLMLTAILVIALIIISFLLHNSNKSFIDNFHNLSDDSLKAKGWMLQSEDSSWWQKRNANANSLTLYTLTGDNWTDSIQQPIIKNLLLRKINADCFTAEVHLDNFIPLKRWQQAGILLIEDTSFSAKILRLSFAYNDFFGGYNKPAEIILQGITSSGNNANNPEEIIHLPVFTFNTSEDSSKLINLHQSALRIEKNGDQFRLLFATGQAENFAFKEALNKQLSFQPKYIGIFALQGFVDNKNYLPAKFKYFSLQKMDCDK